MTWSYHSIFFGVIGFVLIAVGLQGCGAGGSSALSSSNSAVACYGLAGRYAHAAETFEVVKSGSFCTAIVSRCGGDLSILSQNADGSFQVKLFTSFVGGQPLHTDCPAGSTGSIATCRFDLDSTGLLDMDCGPARYQYGRI